jgi:hypothetical protein
MIATVPRSKRKQIAKDVAQVEMRTCAVCGKARWWHLQGQHSRRDDGHNYSPARPETFVPIGWE